LQKKDMADLGPSEELLSRMHQKRSQLERFLAKNRPRKRRLHNTSIFGGSLAGLLTAAPAIGGQPFTAWLTHMLNLNSPSWRILCASATVCSAIATVASQSLKSHNIGARTRIVCKPIFKTQSSRRTVSDAARRSATGMQRERSPRKNCLPHSGSVARSSGDWRD